MKLESRFRAAVSAFLAATRWSPRRLSLEAGLSQAHIMRVLHGTSCTLRTAEAVLDVILTHAPDTAEGRRARALADLAAPAQGASAQPAPCEGRAA